MMAMAAVVAFVSLVPDPAAGQAPTASRWNPPRLPDGQPDMQGLWIAEQVGVPAHSIEDGNDPDDYVIVGRPGEQIPRVIVEPADGRIPYRPAAAAKRRALLADIFTPTKAEHIDPQREGMSNGKTRGMRVNTMWRPSCWRAGATRKPAGLESTSITE